MRHKTHHLYYLYYPRGWIIIIFALLFSATTLSQEQTPPPGQFPVSTTVFDTLISNLNLFNSFEATGFNTIWQRADNTTKNLLENYDLLAINADTLEYIYHYSTSYYSKWEAEKNVDANRVGMKHRDSLGNVIGSTATWNGKSCWSSIGLSGPRDSLMYGPHYRQEKRYKRWHYGCKDGPGCLTYTPRFRMALNYPDTLDPNEDVCVIKVVFRYKDLSDSLHHDTTFIARTLKVGDFNTNGNFDDFYLHPNPQLGIYEYWPNFILPANLSQMVDSEPQVDYIDWEAFTGIQFWVDWLREDTLCTLYIDYAEVYDNAGGNDLFEDSVTAAYTYQNIKDYAESFSDWHNIKYWLGTNEPYTIDAYTPIHIVDSLIRSVGAPPLAVHFDPSWTWNLKINGEDEIEMFYNIANRKELGIGFFPIDLDFMRSYIFESLKRRINYEMR